MESGGSPLPDTDMSSPKSSLHVTGNDDALVVPEVSKRTSRGAVPWTGVAFNTATGRAWAWIGGGTAAAVVHAGGGVAVVDGPTGGEMVVPVEVVWATGGLMVVDGADGQATALVGGRPVAAAVVLSGATTLCVEGTVVGVGLPGLDVDERVTGTLGVVVGASGRPPGATVVGAGNEAVVGVVEGGWVVGGAGRVAGVVDQVAGAAGMVTADTGGRVHTGSGTDGMVVCAGSTTVVDRRLLRSVSRTPSLSWACAMVREETGARRTAKMAAQRTIERRERSSRARCAHFWAAPDFRRERWRPNAWGARPSAARRLEIIERQ